MRDQKWNQINGRLKEGMGEKKKPTTFSRRHRNTWVTVGSSWVVHPPGKAEWMVEGRCSTLDGSTHTRTMNGRQLSCTGCADCRNLAANAVSSTDRPHACAGDPLVYSASFQHPGIAKRASLVSKATPSLIKSARLCFLLCRRDGLYFLWNNRTLETAMGNCQLVCCFVRVQHFHLYYHKL